MKSFIAIALLSLAASLSSAAPTPVCSPQSTATVVKTVTVDGPSPTSGAPTPFATPTGPPITPPLPLQGYQLPVTLPNGVVALGAYLQVSVEAAQPDTTIYETKQIGPDTYMAFEFNLTHAGKKCRFHFAFSAGDGTNGYGSQDVYALTSGEVTDETTYNNKPVSSATRLASFLPGPKDDQQERLQLGDSSNGDSLLLTAQKEDFDCPTKPTGYEVRGAGTIKSSANWSWNHGLIIEVLDESKPWADGLKW
ncbi:uncharacterized protein H6S33_005741 [Morchella sextelata]|uniref:uncharacterized protein n=1 Tax=Morchella sextelata TaxID=1174677 RepID=UPI001D041BF8|nr:uncharacterized protein H6S33_005741 [Morchella sextelata]KAH0613855.1 hypothetical protein H6S33_005741 [Morchella sextelata]